ncbi:hypothetical protein HZA33_03820 [Candidatus Pacearchaeota archaeon]|nr:hypothetical protein [Candidatus Pacearchaeota archaeon]
MATALEIASRMHSQGALDEEIVRTLQEEGFPSQDISDAINQSKIKAAVGEGVPGMGGGMQPSIMQAPEELPVPIPIKKQKQQGQAQQAYSPYPTYQQEEAAYPQTYAEYPQAEAQNYGYSQAGGVDAETIEEIAEEIASEKINQFKMQVGDIAEFKQDTQSSVTAMSERLKRIETNMDRLQAALLGKVQDYGKDIKDLGAEMRALEGAFSKILNPLVDNVKDLSEITERLKTLRGKAKEVGVKLAPIKAKPIIQLEAEKEIKKPKHKVHHRAKPIHHRIKHKPVHHKSTHHKKHVKHKVEHKKIIHHKPIIHHKKPAHHAVKNKAPKHAEHKPLHIEHKPVHHEIHKEQKIEHRPEHKPILHHETKPKHKEHKPEHKLEHTFHLPPVPAHPLALEKKHEEKKEHAEHKVEHKPEHKETKKKPAKKKSSVKVIKEVTKTKTIIKK